MASHKSILQKSEPPAPRGLPWHKFALTNVEEFKSKALNWAMQFDPVCILDSNQYKNDAYGKYDFLLAIGAKKFCRPEVNCFQAWKSFCEENQEWMFGFLSYDLKNEVESLSSRNPDHIELPLLYFFVPQIIFLIRNGQVLISSALEKEADLFREINRGFGLSNSAKLIPVPLFSRISKEDYILKVKKIKHHIVEGDIYEMNFCQEFFGYQPGADPGLIFQRLNSMSKAPFSSFFKLGQKFLICSSPERFIQKSGNRMLSQPIKGTVKRSLEKEEDKVFRNQLYNSEKDRAENVMIVDLVRNDLARSCSPGSIKVDELFGIYPFEFVHHMISTVSGILKEGVHFTEAIKNAFPMGSMTGAPKVMGMELIEHFESSSRGLFSGSVGYVDPNGDFDMNVVIRSILYNGNTGYLSFQVGGAIVFDSDPESEYNECLLKATGMLKVLGN